jgi:hypothetical protein
MELRWHQAVVMLTRYAELKGLKKAETVEEIKTIPVEKPVVVVVEKEPVKEKPVEKPVETVEKPERPNQKNTSKVEEPKKSGGLKIIGSIAGVLGLIVAWLPIPPQFKAIAKVMLSAIANIFK